MKQENETIVPAREAVLVAVIRDQQQERQAVEYLDELEFLAGRDRFGQTVYPAVGQPFVENVRRRG